MDILGKPMILRQIERVSKCQSVNQVVVATSIEKSDDELFKTLTSHKVNVIRGSLQDVHSRFVTAIKQYRPKNVIRLTGDCPLSDPILIDAIVESHTKSQTDYTSNTINRTFPRGLDIEVFTAESFSRLSEDRLLPDELEHVTLGFHNRSNQFSFNSFEQLNNLSRLRWTVDYQEDFDFVRNIYNELYLENHNFGTIDVLRLLEEHPEYSRYESSVD